MEMRQRELKETDSLLESSDPLDSDEQQAIIDDITAEANQLNQGSRWNMRILYLTLAVVFFTVLGFSWVHPFEMSHQRVFKDMVPHVFFQVYYVLMCIIFIVAGVAIQDGISSINLYIRIIGLIICCALSLGWAFIFYAHHVTEPSLYWLPSVPIATIALTWYFDSDNDAFLREVARLNDLKYDYKKA